MAIRQTTLGISILAMLALVGCRHPDPASSASPQPVAQPVAEPAAPLPPPVRAQPEVVVAQPKPSEPMPDESAGALIGHLKTRNNIVTLRAGSNRPLYTVKSVDGRVLARNLSAEELSAQFPGLKEIVERGIADWADINPQYQKTVEPFHTDSMETYGTRATGRTIIERSRGIQHIGIVKPNVQY